MKTYKNTIIIDLIAYRTCFFVIVICGPNNNTISFHDAIDRDEKRERERER